MDTPSPLHAPSPERAAPASDPEVARALKLMIVLSRAISAVQRHTVADVERHGLTIGEFAVLEALYHKGPLLLGDVQRRILVSSGGITYLADRLAAKGLIERRDCEHDRRARFVALTDEGEALMNRIFPEHARRITLAMSPLDAGEQDEAVRLLRKLGHGAAALMTTEPAGPDDD